MKLGTVVNGWKLTAVATVGVDAPLVTPDRGLYTGPAGVAPSPGVGIEIKDRPMTGKCPKSCAHHTGECPAEVRSHRRRGTR